MPQPGAEIELSVDATGWFEAMGGQAALERLVERAAREALSAGAAASGASVVVSVLLTNNARIAELNHAFRNKSAPTDVLSWPSVAWPRPATVADLEALGPEAPAWRPRFSVGAGASRCDFFRARLGTSCCAPYRSWRSSSVRIRSRG